MQPNSVCHMHGLWPIGRPIASFPDVTRMWNALPSDMVTAGSLEVFKKDYQTVTHLDETSHMSAEFVFRYGPKRMGGLILPILVL